MPQDANGLDYEQLRQLIAQVARRTSSHAVRDLMHCLITYADADLMAHPAQGQLAHDLACCLKTVRRLQHKAMTCGLLTVTPHGGPVTGTKGQRPNLYRLNLTVPPRRSEREKPQPRAVTPPTGAETPPDAAKTPAPKTVKVTCSKCKRTGVTPADSETALTGVCAPCRRKDEPPSKPVEPAICQDCGGLEAYHALGPSEGRRCEKCWHRFFTERRR